MKGKVGTPTTLVYIKDKRKKVKHKKGYKWCVKCRKRVMPGEWVSPTFNRCWKHTYPCPVPKETNEEDNNNSDLPLP